MAQKLEMAIQGMTLSIS